MNEHFDNCSCEDVISLYDIWQKLVQHKKVFWSIFFAAFIIGGAVVLTKPKQYTFIEVIEIGKSPDGSGKAATVFSSEDAILRINRVLYPAAIHKYNLKAEKKITQSKTGLKIEKAGDDALLLSINGKLTDENIYKFILTSISQNFSENTKQYVDYRIKTLSESKVNLERRLDDMNDFYKFTIENSFVEDAKKQKGVISTLETKIISMYLNDQNASMVQLTNSINMLQAQIAGTYNTKVISDFTVSDQSVGQSKFVLLFLVAIASLFFAFFGVFVVGFFRGMRANSVDANK